MTSTLTEKAVVGRRVEFTFFRDLPDGPTHPGIITGTESGLSGALRALIRLDGKRSNLSIPVDYEGLTYRDQIVPVPDLPMGPFIPTATYPHPGVLVEKAGVLVTAVGEDGGDLIAITADRETAVTAIRTRAVELGYDPDYLDFDRMKPRWGVFDWEPYDPEKPWAADDWFVRWDAAKGAEKAVHIFHLPTT
ncbi:hypothetical protein [Streptomyces sp. NPDC060001]|uniref:hypothetical protein n=1 Tax=Streptomyces sp. NPDC060001 TaxID=3347032 RepID=UPI0036879783